MKLPTAAIKAVLNPILSKLDGHKQKKEWHNISTLGNIDELGRIASDTAGLLTLYYREQIQLIDPMQKIEGNCVGLSVFSFCRLFTNLLQVILKT